MRKPDFVYAKTKVQLIRAFVNATRIVPSLFFLKQKFQASSHLLWVHSFVSDLVGNHEGQLSHVVAPL